MSVVSAELSIMMSSDTDCSIDGAIALLLLRTMVVTVRRDVGANADTKDAMARKQSIDLIVRIMMCGAGALLGGGTKW
eukprot:scaffold42789_cov155-Skeletonema_dohrnii-CCMP3373.AAC.1